jgi:hypothetical protein
MYIAVNNYKVFSLLETYMLPCLNKKIFGVDCLGCGMQRSISLLLKGDFVAAFYMYPAIYPLLLLLMVTAILTIIISYVIKMKIIFN